MLGVVPSVEMGGGVWCVGCSSGCHRDGSSNLVLDVKMRNRMLQRAEKTCLKLRHSQLLSAMSETRG